MAQYIPEDMQVDQAAIDRQRQLAQMLQQQGMQAPQGQMVSGRYVGPSWTQYLANGLANYRGQTQQIEADKKQKALADALQGRREAWVNSMPQERPEQVAPMGPPTEQGDMGTSITPAQAPNQQDMLRWGMEGQRIDPQMAQLGMTMAQKDNTLTPVKAGEALYSNRTRQPVFFNPAVHEPSSTIQEYNIAKQQGYPGTIQEFMLEQKKAGATKVSTETKINNSLGQGVAKEIGPMVKESYDAARGGQQQITSSDSLIKAVDSGNLYSGPGASFRLYGAQLAQSLGVGGKDMGEKVSNTRAAIQGLAQGTLAARSSLKGQGQVSDFEGKLVQRAASGDIDSLTGPEIKQIAEVNKRLAKQLIDNHSQMIGKLKGKEATADLADMFDLPQQNITQPAAPTSGWSIKPL